jgi:hypothetical protein
LGDTTVCMSAWDGGGAVVSAPRSRVAQALPCVARSTQWLKTLSPTRTRVLFFSSLGHRDGRGRALWRVVTVVWAGTCMQIFAPCVVFLVRFGHSALQGLAPTTPVQTTRLPPLPPHHATANVARSCSLFGVCAPRGRCMSVIGVKCVVSPCTFMALAREEGGEMKAGRDGSQIRRSLRTSALRRRASPHSHSFSVPITSVSLFIIHSSRAKRIPASGARRVLAYSPSAHSCARAVPRSHSPAAPP